MKFNEKMVFLMETTGTSNKVLATNINVDPSMISLLRTGKRGKPRNEEHLHAMANYFASQFQTMYQRETLSEVIGQFNLKYKSNYLDIAPVLFEWLRNDNYQPPGTIERTLAGLHKLYDEINSSAVSDQEPYLPNTFTEEPLSAGSLPKETMIFYEDSGKMKAISLFHHLLLQNPKETFTLYFTSDESNGWYLDNQNIHRDVIFWKKLIDQTHCRICLILPPSSSPIFLDILAEWLPLFLTGQIDVYYYPRTRDRVYRRTMMVVKNKAALFSDSIDSAMTSGFSVFTMDRELINTNLAMFQGFLAKCQQTFQVHFALPEIQACFMKYVSIEADSIMISHTLPQSSMPLSCMQLMFSKEIKKDSAVQPEKSSPAAAYQNFRDSAERRYREHVTIEISVLSSYEEVLDQKVNQYYPGNNTDQQYIYTPETYVMHLKNIVCLLKTYPNYYFIPYRNDPYQMDTIIVKPNRYALICEHVQPIRVMEIEQPALIQPFYEFLTNIADRSHYSGIGKRRIISQLEDLIDEFERQM